MLKYVLLALLAERPRHGYELKSAFDALLQGSWPLNIGQVYTTLGRLERDGLVSHEVVEQQERPDRKVHELTAVGEKELRRWLDEPAAEPARLKDELYLKLLVHTIVDHEDAAAYIREQRRLLLDTLADVTASQADADGGIAASLLLEAAALHLEADLRWLDRCEDVLARSAS